MPTATSLTAKYTNRLAFRLDIYQDRGKRMSGRSALIVEVQPPGNLAKQRANARRECIRMASRVRLQPCAGGLAPSAGWRRRRSFPVDLQPYCGSAPVLPKSGADGTLIIPCSRL
jgi:hypothetical protein